MRSWTTLFALFLSLASLGQHSYDESKVSSGTNEIIEDIKAENIVMSSAVGIAGMRPPQYDNFIKLKANASTEELKELTKHPNTTVRCYSFWALAYIPAIDLFQIVIDHLEDTASVTTLFGCIESRESVGDFFIKVVTPNYIDPNSRKLDSMQFANLDSILIYRPNNLSAKSRAINRAQPKESLYPKIRELVIKENNQAALVTLAKYQKVQDIDLILTNTMDSETIWGSSFSTYEAISQFPHADFLAFLEDRLMETLDDTHYSIEWRDLYKAIASYKSEKAVALLLVPFTQVEHVDMRTHHLDFVYGALEEFKDPIYTDLLWKFWSEENRISLEVFRYLWRANPDKAFELIKVSLTKFNELFYTNSTLNTQHIKDSQKLYTLMLELAIKRDREFSFEIIKRNIKEANVHLFPIFADKVVALKDRSFIEPLLNRLETEWNAHIYLKIVQALIAYQDPEINQKIVATRSLNPKLNEGWGSESLDEILKDNNIK